MPFNDGPALLAAVQEPGTVAVLLEPIQGESGVQPGDARSFCSWRAICATGTTCC